MRNRILVLLGIAALWAYCQPTYLQTWDGEASPGQLAFFRRRGAVVSATRHGMRVRVDRAGLLALGDWRAYLWQRFDTHNDNLMHDSDSFRGRSVSVDAQGDVKTVDLQVNWVYDPSNPLAEREGQYRGYVSKSGVNRVKELGLLRKVEHELATNQRDIDWMQQRLDVTFRLKLDPSS